MKQQLENAKGKVVIENRTEYVIKEDEEKAKLLADRMAKMIAELQINKEAMGKLEKELEE